jgi:demethylmenaquinone methyltransferase/2-methoxy-6-polyprenyl-1,4-benzoquinol methylase
MSETASFGYRDVDADQKAGMVRAVFSNVAAKYDLMNDVCGRTSSCGG